MPEIASIAVSPVAASSRVVAADEARDADRHRTVAVDLEVLDEDPGAEDPFEVRRQPLGEPRLRVVHDPPPVPSAGSPASSRRKPSSSSTGIPSSAALASFEPAPGPATT